MQRVPHMRLLAITIDTEADTGPSWIGQTPESYRNVGRLETLLLPIADRLGIPITLLLNGDVIVRDVPAHVCDRLHRTAGWELGTHLHGEFEMPELRYSGPAGVKLRDLQASYSADVEFGKMSSITNHFSDRFGRLPTSFRAGRFGASMRTLEYCADLGYEVDRSVVPGQCWWEDDTKIDFTAFSPDPRIIRRNHKALVELPITVKPGRLPFSFNRRLQHVLNSRTHKKRGVPSSLGRCIRRVTSVLLRPVWLRPSYASADQMCALLRWLAGAYGSSPIVANMMFHSSELLPGASPYTQTEDDVNAFLERLTMALRTAGDLEYRFATLSESARAVKSHVSTGTLS